MAEIQVFLNSFVNSFVNSLLLLFYVKAEGESPNADLDRDKWISCCAFSLYLWGGLEAHPRRISIKISVQIKCATT